MPQETDIKTCTDSEAVALCARLRQDIIKTVSQTGGHLASNLGTVEITVALHRVFALERDRLVFDVGHQCYVHKLLTGRGPQFHTLRTFGGVAGYPKPAESPSDAFIAGHASNSVSVALGMAYARTLTGGDYHVMALIGDGALTGGLAYEGLSNAGQSGQRIIVILNDNGMSITPNVGGTASYLAHQRLKPQYLRFKKAYRRFMGTIPLGKQVNRVIHKIKNAIKDALLPCSMFEGMGFTYMGPVDGHDVSLLTRLLRYAKEEGDGPILLHIRTVKGKGYPPAVLTPEKFHGVGAFCIDDGSPCKLAAFDFSAAFGRCISRLAQEDKRLCVITAAMQSGTGLQAFSEQHPERFFDVGIAEGHAVAMAAGLAKQGMIPVFAVYSSFLQRGYDMLLHDVALSGLHVVFTIDRAGLVGEDGETHHGIFDVGFLSTVPGMTLLAPACYRELDEMLEWAIHRENGPVAIRYPRGVEGTYNGSSNHEKTLVLKSGQAITLVTYGTTIEAICLVAERLALEGISAQVIKLNCILPLDATAVIASVAQTGRLLVAEECVAQGSVGRQLMAALATAHVSVGRVALVNVGEGFVTHGTMAQLRKLCGLDADSLYKKAKEVYGGG